MTSTPCLTNSQANARRPSEVRTEHANAASFAAFAHYSVPHIVCFGSTLGQAAVAGLVAMLLDVMLAAHLHTTPEVHYNRLQLARRELHHGGAQ